MLHTYTHTVYSWFLQAAWIPVVHESWQTDRIAGSFASFSSPVTLSLSSIAACMLNPSMGSLKVSTRWHSVFGQTEEMPHGRGSQTYLFLMHLNSAKTSMLNQTLFTEKYEWHGWQQLCVPCSAFFVFGSVLHFFLVLLSYA